VCLNSKPYDDTCFSRSVQTGLLVTSGEIRTVIFRAQDAQARYIPGAFEPRIFLVLVLRHIVRPRQITGFSRSSTFATCWDDIALVSARKRANPVEGQTTISKYFVNFDDFMRNNIGV